jgi:hypothetical protein
MKRPQQPYNLPPAPLQREPLEPEAHSEPFGHVHPNYRHWAWFRPNHW